MQAPAWSLRETHSTLKWSQKATNLRITNRSAISLLAEAATHLTKKQTVYSHLFLEPKKKKQATHLPPAKHKDVSSWYSNVTFQVFTLPSLFTQVLAPKPWQFHHNLIPKTRDFPTVPLTHHMGVVETSPPKLIGKNGPKIGWISH